MEINEDVFWDLYGPFDIHEDIHGIPHGTPIRHLWTIVEGSSDDTLYALPGYHKVNRIMWVTSTQPWSSEETTGVWYTPIDADVF